jgi:AcrR family transcriptional regulator
MIEFMKAIQHPKRRLNRNDWITSSLDLLAAEGIGAVTVDRLASGLGVTRGSFYHHFSNRDELLDALLDHWADQLTYRIRDQVINLQLDPETTLLVLLRTIRSEEAAKYDAPFRAWALHDERARAVLKRVDQSRFETVRAQFERLGFDQHQRELRARLFLYYEIAAPAMFLDQSGVGPEAMMQERLRFLTAL